MNGCWLLDGRTLWEVRVATGWKFQVGRGWLTKLESPGVATTGRLTMLDEGAQSAGQEQPLSRRWNWHSLLGRDLMEGGEAPMPPPCPTTSSRFCLGSLGQHDSSCQLDTAAAEE